MKTKSNQLVQRGLILLLIVVLVSCNLDVQVKNPNVILPVSPEGAPPPESLSTIYAQLNGLTTDQGDWFGMAEHTTDELMGPTRGTDWDDFGTWRKLHLHTWDGTHNQVVTAWNNIQSGLFQTTLLAESTTASASDIAAAQFLRSFWRYMSMDMYGIVQHRLATAAALDLPDVYTRSEACDATITELEGAVANLPSYNGTNKNIATKEAAYFLLAKLYLNKAVFKNDPTLPAGPFNFDAGDMNKVISYVDLITASSTFSFKIADNYWDNFSWKNNANSTENIFVRTIADGGNMRWPTYMGAHYNMVPSGWNGFVVLSDFYNKFDTIHDARAYDTLAGTGYHNIMGRNAGFLTGQQYGPTDASGHHVVGAPIKPLTDRSGSPLIFTKSASLYFSTESKGYRTNKYPLDPSTLSGSGDGSASLNDYVFYRYADALLMKAEAILRGGTPTLGNTPDQIVNDIRKKRSNGTTALAALSGVDLPTLLDERGRELYLEAVRRNDLVRFGKFNEPVVERPSASDASRCIFPIPSVALASNPNLKQNSGY